MKLSLDNNAISRIKEILLNVTSQHEIEFRLGKYDPRIKRFVPGVSKSVFNQLLKSLKQKYKYTTIDSTVNYYDNDIRTIDGIAQQKIKIADTDISFVNIDIRLSKSKEETKSKEPSGKVKFTRKRTRYVFVFDYYNIELTVVDDGKLIYEVEIEFTKLPLDINKVMLPLKFVLELMFPKRISLINESEYIETTRQYNKLFEGYIRSQNINVPYRKIVRFENKPRNIKRHDIQNMNNYSVTNKLNGIGAFMMISEKGLHIINQTDIDNLSRKTIGEYTGTLFHGEWFEKGFYIFDVLKFQGIDITTKTHPQRLKFAEEILPLLIPILLESGVNIEIKTFICTGNLERDILNIMRYMYNRYGSKALENNDGIMFTPVEMPYLNKDTLKFKFPSTMTIDFYIDNKNEEFSFSSISSERKDKTTFNVKVYDKSDKKVLFDSTFKHKLNPILTVYPNDVLYSSLDNGMIVEALYDRENKTFVPTRIRDDKDMPNFIGVASDVFNDIMDPLELDTLVKLIHDKYVYSKKEVDSDKKEKKYYTTKKEYKKKEIKEDCLEGMRKYNNNIKRDLIMEYTREKKVLDLGFGYGGDIHKYADADVEFVWGVEPNDDNYKEAQKRILAKSSMKDKVKIIPLKAQESGDIFDKMKDSKKRDQKADVVASFFSLTFFFENEKELDRLINTVAQGVKLGGYFIGTTMDGESTYNYFKDKIDISIPNCYEMSKHYEDDDKFELGKKIKINLDDTIVKDQFEYLVFFDLFVTKLAKRGLMLLKTQMFNPPSFVDPKIVDFNKLFRSFVFERFETEDEKKTRKQADYNKEIMGQERENVMKIIPTDKTLAFNNEIDEKTQLVRTGTVADGACFVEGTRVYTNNGVKNIENVEIGDEVVTHLGNVKKVLQTHKNLLNSRWIHSLEVYKTPVIKVTDNHKIYSCKELGKNKYSDPSWNSVGNLNVGDYVMIPKKTQTNKDIQPIDLFDICNEIINENVSYKCDEKFIHSERQYNNNKNTTKLDHTKKSQKINRYWNIDEDFCEFLGMWYGDGCVSARKNKYYQVHKGITIVSTNENKKLIDFVINTGEKIFGIKSAIHNHSGQNLVSITFNNVVIGTIFNHLFGHGFDGKRLPKFLYNASDECINSFLAGLISTDGNVRETLYVSVQLTNPPLVEEIYHLCRSIGIPVSVRYINTQSNKMSGKIFFPTEYINLEKIKKVYNDDRMEQLLKIKRNTRNITVNGLSISRSDCKSFMYNNNTFLRITKNNITLDDPRYVYTLGVEDDHSYAVEGIIVQNCFFHSVLRAIDPNYVKLTPKEREKLVAKLREKMSNNLTREMYASFGKGLLAYGQIIPKFTEIIKSRKEFSDIADFIDPISKDNISEYIASLLELVHESKRDKITELFEKIYDKYYNIFKETLKDCNAWVGQEPGTVDVFEYVSDTFNIDIYLIRDRTRKPYKSGTDCSTRFKNRKSILVLWVGNAHYEVIGRLEKGNKVTRIFDSTDPFIEKINSMVC